ncbi:MAG: hypothetical protein IKP47_12415 [Ruminococcus sp.]|nr:hypothetical protein [Ruminococcus sp.]
MNRNMSISSLAKGISVGITAGAVAFAVANATSRQRRDLKKSAARALRAFGDIVDGVGDIMR